MSRYRTRFVVLWQDSDNFTVVLLYKSIFNVTSDREKLHMKITITINIIVPQLFARRNKHIASTQDKCLINVYIYSYIYEVNILLYFIAAASAMIETRCLRCSKHLHRSQNRCNIFIIIVILLRIIDRDPKSKLLSCSYSKSMVSFILFFLHYLKQLFNIYKSHRKKLKPSLFYSY